jgi:LysM repeat protein
LATLHWAVLIVSVVVSVSVPCDTCTGVHRWCSVACHERTDVRNGSSGVGRDQTPVRLDTERVFVLSLMFEQVFVTRLRGFLSQGPGRIIAMTAVAFAQQQFSFPSETHPRPQPVVSLVRSIPSDAHRDQPTPKPARSTRPQTSVTVLPVPARQATGQRAQVGSLARLHAGVGVRPITRRSIDVGVAGAPLAARPVWLVRLALVALVSVLAVAGLLLSAGTSGQGPVSGPAATVAVPAATDGSAAVHVVQPGDTLWSIAAAVAPGSDPRPIVDELARRSGGAGLQPGQRIAIEGLGR